MKGKLKKIIATLFTAGIIFGGVSMTASAETTEIIIPEDAIASGVIDEDYGHITWFIDKNGHLTVKGTGDVVDPDKEGSRPVMSPWYSDSIVSAEIDVTGMTDASNLFVFCHNLKSVDFSEFDTSQVTDMSNMFYECYNLESVDLSGFDTSNVINMADMFFECYSLESLDLSSFDTSQVRSMSLMFYSCMSLKNLDISSFDTSRAAGIDSMFTYCCSLESLDLSHFSTSHITDMSNMFLGCTSLKNLDLSHFDTSGVTDMSDMFKECKSLESLDISHFDTSNVTNMGGMFENCASLTTIDLSGFDTSNVVNMIQMFFGCSGLKSLDVSGFDTSNVVNMSGMFSTCSELKALDLRSFDTSKVTNMFYMFTECEKLEKLDLSSFDTSCVENMVWTFRNCKSLTELDLSNFNTESLTKAYQMFLGCTNLRELDLSSFDLKNQVAGIEETFNECDQLRKIAVPINCVQDIALPLMEGCDWKTEDGTVVTQLPKDLSTSITITRNIDVTKLFDDVYDDWYTPYVQYVYDNNLMTGIKGTEHFAPNANITKAQVAQVLYNMAGQPNVENVEVFSALKDVYQAEWYADAVAWAYNNQIVTGDRNTKKFNPNTDVTREQLALMVYRYAKCQGLDTSATSDLAGLKNAENVSNWGIDGMKWAVGEGLISGVDKNGVKDLAPQGNATRAQMAAILQRFCENTN